MLRASLISLLSLGVVAQEPAKAPTPATAPAAVSAPVLASAPGVAAPKPEDVLLAKVGGEPITEGDFQAAFRLLGQQEQMQVLMVQGGKEEFIKRMAESKLLSVKAKRLELDKTPNFLRALDRTKDDLLAREFLIKEGEALQKKLAVSEADVKTFFTSHPERFNQPELVTVRHILVTVKKAEGQPGLTDAEAKARIAKIQGEIKKGAKFDALAKKYTDDPGSKESGGLYADQDPSGWVPEFGAAARTQTIGKVGAPVKTMFGYHLIKVEGRKPARQIPFEEAKGPAEKMAQQERQATIWNELMDGLRKEIPFEMMKPAPVPEAPKPAEPAKEPAAVKTPEPVKGGAQ